MTRSPALLKMGPQEAVIHEMEKDQLSESILRTITGEVTHGTEI